MTEGMLSSSRAAALACALIVLASGLPAIAHTPGGPPAQRVEVWLLGYEMFGSPGDGFDQNAEFILTVNIEHMPDHDRKYPVLLNDAVEEVEGTPHVDLDGDAVGLSTFDWRIEQKVYEHPVCDPGRISLDASIIESDEDKFTFITFAVIGAALGVAAGFAADGPGAWLGVGAGVAGGISLAAEVNGADDGGRNAATVDASPGRAHRLPVEGKDFGGYLIWEVMIFNEPNRSCDEEVPSIHPGAMIPFPQPIMEMQDAPVSAAMKLVDEMEENFTLYLGGLAWAVDEPGVEPYTEGEKQEDRLAAAHWVGLVAKDLADRPTGRNILPQRFVTARGDAAVEAGDPWTALAEYACAMRFHFLEQGAEVCRHQHEAHRGTRTSSG